MNNDYIRKHVYGIQKEGGGALATAATNIASGTSLYLMALLATSGIVTGWVGAKMTAKGDQDINTVKKEYENERLKADLGYLKTKTESEYDAFKRQEDPKAARVIA